MHQKQTRGQKLYKRTYDFFETKLQIDFKVTQDSESGTLV